MPLNSWEEFAEVALALGLEMLDVAVAPMQKWGRSFEHLGAVSPKLPVRDIIRRGHLAHVTRNPVLEVNSILKASWTVVLQVLATNE
jgi:hypothetical protein